MNKALPFCRWKRGWPWLLRWICRAAKSDAVGALPGFVLRIGLGVGFGLGLAVAAHAQTQDWQSLWDFSQPAASERRFVQALAQANGDLALILQTQIARSHGLRRDFAQARRVLAQVEPALASAGAEVQVRYWLELGRTLVSATHQPEDMRPEDRERARLCWDKALSLARQARLDGLTVDALHMFAFLDPAPAEQLRWGEAALAVVLASEQPAARRWEASIRHNLGYALFQLGRYPQALEQFQKAVVMRERSGKASAVREARWMVAWTLRAMQRLDEALAIQQDLDTELLAQGQVDPEVLEELELLYLAKGHELQAQVVSARRAALKSAKPTAETPTEAAAR